VPESDDVPDADALTVLERELALLMRRAAGFSAQLARELHPDLESSAYSLLVWLDTSGPARLTDLAGAFGVGKATLSRQVQLLERLNLITREPEPNDGRSQLLQVTAPAADRLHAVRAARLQRFRSLLAAWPQGDIESLGQLLERLNTTIPSTNAKESS